MNTVLYRYVRVAALVALLAVSATGGERTDFLVNRDGGITEQNHPRVAVAADGSFVIVWVDNRKDAQDIYMQRFDAQGQPMGANQLINDDGGQWTHQAEPAIAADLSGLYSVVWTDYRNGTYPFNPAVFFQRYDSSLFKIGVNRDLTAASPNPLKESPDISLSQWGGGVVVWADYRNGNWDIYGQRISPLGALTGSAFRVNTDVGSAQQHAPKVSVSPDGWFVVVWYDNRAGQDDILAQLYDSLGTPSGGNFLVGNDSNNRRQAFPDVAADGTGHFSVVWVDWRNGVYPQNPDIYIRKFDTSRVALTNATKVNSDNRLSPQREVAIAIDRMGHAAVVWSDSTVTSWEITGQMIDVNGAFKGENFRANSFGDSAQFHPDVAVDGRYRYTTWADKRKGHYDVYASISLYNDPQLMPSPGAMKFAMDVSEPVPSAQTLTIQHNGYNPLSFQAIRSHDWITVSPASGQTPASISVGIATDTLPFGTYLGAITLIDTDDNDSSVVVSVRLDVTAPILQLSHDTLTLRAFAGINEYQWEQISVLNAGTGSFSWTATEITDWLLISQSAGTDGTSITVGANAVGLTGGNYQTNIIFSAPGAVQSPDTLLIVLEVVDNMPYLRLSPDSIYLRVIDTAGVEMSVTVNNIGAGNLSWVTQGSSPWLTADPASGVAGETVTLTINPRNLINDLYGGWIDFTDSASFSITERLPVVLDLLIPPDDTIWFGSVAIPVNGEGVVPIELWCNNEISSLTLPIKLDPEAVTVDSMVVAPGLDLVYHQSIEINPTADQLTLRLDPLGAGSFLARGHHWLGEIYLSATENNILSTVDTARFSNLRVNLVTTQMESLVPMILPGEIIVGTPTDVEEGEELLLPETPQLDQNYPNPFNSTTIIGFDLPTGDLIDLEIFNILGQQVVSLIDGYLPAGHHQAIWHGQFADGRTAPSGVYFYRLTAGATSRVKKLVLLK